VLVGSVYVVLQRVAAGGIVHAGGEGTIVFGELAGGPTERTWRLEVEALSGAVVRRGRTYDLATPVHQAIWACLSVHQP
jgi:ketopantoate reductase